MTEYIITEEGIGTIRDYVLSAFYKGESKDKIYELLKSEFSVIRSNPYNPQAEREGVLDELEETIDNWWRTYNYLDYDTYRRITDKTGKNRFKHHHNMRTHIYKKYKMFFDCCKSPEGIQRMREFNQKVKKHLKYMDGETELRQGGE